MLDWLKQIDPTLVVMTVIGLATWGYHKVKGDKTDSLADHIEAFARQAVSQLLDTPGDQARASLRARELIESEIWKGLARLGVKADKVPTLVKGLVSAAVEHGLAELH